MHAADIGPVPPDQRTQRPFDLFLIFAGANIVATTLQVGASLAPTFRPSAAFAIIAVGTVLGAGLVASLAPIGPLLGVPSVIAARAPLGLRGAGLVAGLLYLTNFAWLAVNNVIAASACARVFGGPGSERAWAVLLGLAATAVVAGGPRLVGRADRLAVPLLFVTGVVLTIGCLRTAGATSWPVGASGGWASGLDVVMAYQVSWILMFADYSRYTASAGKGTLAVFLGLALTSLWFIPLGYLASSAAHSYEPGAMLAAVGIGVSGAVLLTLATLTTNFVNIYLSSLALKSLRPQIGEQMSIWGTGIIGAALSLLSSAWLDRYSAFMLVLGAILVPVGGVLLAHYFLMHEPVSVEALYDRRGAYARHGGFSFPAMVAWAAGSGVYFASRSIGGTLPAILTAVVLYWAGQRLLSPHSATTVR